MRIRAGGIKVSPPLAQLDLARGEDPDPGVAALLDSLSTAQLNLPLFTQHRPPAPMTATLCVAESDLARAEELALGIGALQGRLTVHNPVVAVSVYPHRSQAVLLGAILGALSDQQLTPLVLATSLSALTFTLPADRLARCLAGLEKVLELPDNHAPLRWELLVKQTPP